MISKVSHLGMLPARSPSGANQVISLLYGSPPLPSVYASHHLEQSQWRATIGCAGSSRLWRESEREFEWECECEGGCYKGVQEKWEWAGGGVAE